jgi:hypothetical protein
VKQNLEGSNRVREMFVMAGKKRMLHDTLYDWCMGAWRLVFCNTILNKLQRQHSINLCVKALGALLVVSRQTFIPYLGEGIA